MKNIVAIILLYTISIHASFAGFTFPTISLNSNFTLKQHAEPTSRSSVRKIRDSAEATTYAVDFGEWTITATKYYAKAPCTFNEGKNFAASCTSKDGVNGGMRMGKNGEPAFTTLEELYLAEQKAKSGK